MDTGRLIRKSYIMTFAFLGAVCLLVLFIFSALFMEKAKASEGEQFIRDTEALFPSIQDFALAYSDETLAEIAENNLGLDLGFCLRTVDGSLIWLSGEALEFKSNKSSQDDVFKNSQVTGYIFPDSGFSPEDFYNLTEYASWRIEKEGTTYQYKVEGNNVVKGDGFFFIPSEVQITSYIVDDPLKINSTLTRLPGMETIRLSDNRNSAGGDEKNISYSGTIKAVELPTYNEATGFADDINRFELTSEAYESGGDRTKWLCEDLRFMKKVFTSISPVKALYRGDVISARVVFAKYVDFGKVYGTSFIILILLALTIFIISGLIICSNTKKSILAMAAAEEKRRLMVNSIAHDLKTPAAAISAYAELIKDSDFEEDREVFADKIMKNSETLESQLRNIIMFSKMDRPDFKLQYEETALKAMTEEVIEGFEHDPAFASISITGSEIRISADRKLLRMAVENFISNAFKNVSGEDKKITIEINERYWSVFNTGSRIKEENLNKIWDAWFVEDESGRGSGSGLGLFIAKTILDAHNMTYKAENEDGGVRFTFYYSHLLIPQIETIRLSPYNS